MEKLASSLPSDPMSVNFWHDSLNINSVQDVFMHSFILNHHRALKWQHLIMRLSWAVLILYRSLGVSFGSNNRLNSIKGSMIWWNNIIHEHISISCGVHEWRQQLSSFKVSTASHKDLPTIAEKWARSFSKQHMWEGWSRVMHESCDNLNHWFSLFRCPSRRPRVSQRG